MPGVLRLEARDYDGPARWRWVLADAAGAFVADHEVRIDEHSWQYEAFTDLRHYISWHAAPDRYAEDEARIVAEVGRWIGAEAFGPVTDALAKAAKRAPVTVRVVAGEDAKALLFRPLELAHAGGRPLTAQDVTLVMQTAGDDSADDAVPVGGRLRVLGLFSLPEGGRPLNLRRERHALVRLINRIAAHGRAAEVRVLQYGVTRERLREVLEEAEGWDVIHISGHGAPGELLLEAAAGTPDKVTAAELADLLEPAREHVKLVTVSACWSAAVTAAEQRRLLGLPIGETSFPERARGGSSSPGNFATELTERLGCAVLAMRYPVTDDFAIELSEKLYDRLAAKGQPLARAVGMTVRELTAGNRFPALSAATPALFGAPAAELRLAAPERAGSPSYGTGELKMAGFPPQPERFVGRAGVMARSSAALADESGIPGVLLHGMPGGGKTACALELAYTHEHAFDRLVWYKAPDEGMEIGAALTDFALTLERYLEGFQMVHLVGDADKLAGFLPRLTELMERNRLLVVIDNAESFLSESGRWRDDRWGRVIGALTAHRGFGRLLMTSRRVAETRSIRVEPIDALSADEALLLARELPHLKKLISGEISGLDREDARKLALGVLNVAQGHPKLLELADGQAARPEWLAALVAAGDQAWREQGGLPEGFFDAAEPTADPGDYLHVLAAWTKAVTDTLSRAERDLFWFLCCLEEPDRDQQVVNTLWPFRWRNFSLDGQPPELAPVVMAISACGLVAIQKKPGTAPESYAIHPGIAAAGRAHAGKRLQETVDWMAENYWDTGHQIAFGDARSRDLDTQLLVRAGLAAIPYLLRQKQWAKAARLLESAFNRNPSRPNAAAVLPAIQQITRHYPGQERVLAKVLMVLDPVAGDARLRTIVDDAAARGDYRTASVAAEDLITLYRDSGRLAEALALATQKTSYTRQAELGSWIQLADEVRRLQVLIDMGQAHQVLDDIRRLFKRADALPPPKDPDEALPERLAWEMLFDTARYAVVQLGHWQNALDLNAAQINSMRDRRAPAADIARTRFHDYFPLLRLGRANEAVDLLLDCRQVFEDAHDTRMLGRTLAALANAENDRGDSDAAIRLQRDALRYMYLIGDMIRIAVGYHNLGNYLRRARRPGEGLASHLIAALIRVSVGIDGPSLGSATGSVHAAAADLREFATDDEPPSDVADLCRKIGDIPGTDPASLIARLFPDPGTAGRALQDLIAKARKLAEAPPEDATPE